MCHSQCSEEVKKYLMSEVAKQWDESPARGRVTSRAQSIKKSIANKLDINQKLFDGADGRNTLSSSAFANASVNYPLAPHFYFIVRIYSGDPD
jgi:hypothetical protein